MKYLFALCLAFSAAVAWGDGTVPLEDTYYFTFNTVAPSTGAPITMGGTPEIEVYEENGTTQITAGDTFAEDLDGVTGLHGVMLVCSAANGYEAGKWYVAVIAGTTPTADSVSVAGRTVARFRVMAAEAAAGEPLATVDGANSTGLLDSTGVTTAVENAAVTLAADQSGVTSFGGATTVMTLKSLTIANSDAGASAVSITGSGTGNSHGILVNSTNGKALALGSTNSDAVTIDSSAAKGIVINGATADIDANITGTLSGAVTLASQQGPFVFKFTPSGEAEESPGTIELEVVP